MTTYQIEISATSSNAQILTELNLQSLLCLENAIQSIINGSSHITDTTARIGTAYARIFEIHQ